MSSEQRAALADRIKERIYQEWEVWEDGEAPGDRTYSSVAAEAALAAVEAAGGWPRPEPVTEEEIQAMYRAAVTASQGAKSIEAMVARVHDAVLAALPERHRAVVLGSRGITVEGAK